MSWTTAESLRLLSVSHLAVLAILFLVDRKPDRARPYTLFFLVTALCYVAFPGLTGWPEFSFAAWAHLLFAGRSAGPFAFWLLSRVQFGDGFRLRPIHGALLALQLAVNHTSVLLPALLEPPLRASWGIVPRGVSLLFVADALARIYKGSRDDLVESRLRQRDLVLTAIGSYTILVLLAELVLDRVVVVPADLANAALNYVLCFGASLILLRREYDVLGRPRKLEASDATAPALVEKLHRLVEQEKIFREEGLTIRGLAGRVGAPEHTLRRLINSELGFRNFNAFLHHYRIREAQRIMKDPESAKLSISEIAYGLGYASLGPFNRAFKDRTGLTPTELRRALQDRLPSPIPESASLSAGVGSQTPPSS